MAAPPVAPLLLPSFPPLLRRRRPSSAPLPSMSSHALPSRRRRRLLFAASFSLLLLLFVLLLFESLPPSHASAPAQELPILLQLKEQLADPQGRLSTWTSGTTPCAWYGVECTPSGQVSALMLAGAGLQGDLSVVLPPLLQSLSMLRVLDLSNNFLKGSLSGGGSSSLRCAAQQQQQLQELDLSFNNITGPLPDDLLLHCSALRKLDLSHNSFTSTLPAAGFPGGAASLAELYLSFNSLIGSLPPSFVSSPFLKILDVSGNRLSSAADPFSECGAALASINLSSNDFSGGVPASLLQSCASLQYLNLSNNKFAGALPTAYLPGIKSLDISNNELSGAIPSTLPCATLQLLDLSFNNLSGSIPRSLAGCRSLEHLDLAHNNLSGVVPSATLAQMSSLETLRLSFNKFSGPLPAEEIGAGCPRLKVLDMASNRLSGGVPAEICAGAASLQELRLPNNELSGMLPASLANCSQLTALHLSFNDLEGPIPSELGSLEALVTLSIWYNRLSGPIPAALGRLQRLKILILNDNGLSGEIPSELSNCTSLEWISASNNRLSGAIPASMGEMPRLTLLQLGNNSLSGEIPAEIATGSMFVWLDLHGNCLSGGIPARLGQHPGRAAASRVTGAVFAFVRNELLSGCRGMGMLLEFAGVAEDALARTPFMTASCNTSRLYVGDVLNKDPDLTSVQYLDLSYNNLSGAIPPEMGDLTALAMLSLGHNQLSGTIPASFSHLSGIGVIDLSYNLLQGSIFPLANCSFLVAIDVSHNNFSGRIPSTGQLTTAPAAGFAGNPLLCGEPLQAVCGSSQSGGGAEDCRSGSGCGRHRVPLLPWANSIVLGILIAVAFVCMLVVSGIMLRAKGMKLHRDRYGVDGMQLRSSSLSAAAAAACYGNHNGGMGVGGGGGSWKAASFDKEPLSINVATFERPLRKLTFAHLIEATNGFSQESLIGIGGFGEVYKAELKDGSVVAIKKLLQFSYQGDREFTAEMETLGKIKHRNLVPLLGYCKVGEERLLVYEYMKGGSLEDVLHGGGGGGEGAAPPPTPAGLTWEQRKQIMRGAARGLSFLHHNCIPHIIHRDMKSSNVLLDENLEARVSDFGMARLISALDTHLSVSTLAGTPGYVPPEYYQSFRCTTKGDIYSFGVILLELLTGKKPIDKEFFEDTNLVGWVKHLVRDGRSVEALDTALTSSLSSSGNVDEMLQYLAIASDCVQEQPSARPSMLEVVSMMKQIQLQHS